MRQDAGYRQRSDCFSFAFLDCLEEAEGEHLEQPGRYHPAAQVPPLMAESQVPGVNTRQRQQYGDTMGTHHQCHASAGGGGCGMGSLELLCCTCGNLGDPDLFL